MITYFFIPLTEPEADFDHPDGTLPINPGGSYFFLYPYLLKIRDCTGEMIDTQSDATFRPDTFPVVLEKLIEARKAAESGPSQVVVHVGKQITPTPRDLFEEVSRTEIFALIDALISVFKEAATKNSRLYLTEY